MLVILFPAAFMANGFAMMAVMIGLSLFGRPELAADFGLVHGATVALFYALSGNARSLILGEVNGVDAAAIIRLRLILLLPLTMLAYILCIGIVDGGWLFVLLLVVRRAAEWLAEVFLSDQELRHQTMRAMLFLLGQGTLSLVLLLALLNDSVLALLITLVWALSPLLGCMSLTLLRRALCHTTPVIAGIRLMLPHFGSTVVIGVSVYVFRLFILLLAGKEVAGDLFSAFAMGGILGAVFSQALGPTMVRQEQQASVQGGLVQAFNWMLLSVLSTGLVLVVSVWMIPDILSWTQKGQLFWLAVGWSLVGGVVMVLAQRIRLRILQYGDGRDVFGSDMLANLLLVGCIPFFLYGIGLEMLATLYLFSGVLSLVFYASEEKGLFNGGKFMFRIEHRWLLPVLALMLFIPVFFQLASGLYIEEGRHFSSGGSLVLLPIPLSVAACYVGIVLLGGFSQVRVSLVTIFLTFIVMLVSSALLFSEYGNYERTKLILLIQYLLPMFALVLGQQFGARQESLTTLSGVLLWLLMAVISLQLISTVVNGLSYLSPSLFVFSIYQHLQYVPALLVGAFFIALFSLWEQPETRRWLSLLAALIGIYAALSVSMLSMGLLVVGVFCFTLRCLMLGPARGYALVAAVLAIGSLLLGLFYMANARLLKEKLGIVGGSDADSGTVEGPKNLQERLVYWRYYLAGITESIHSFLLGHSQAPDRDKYPSAHNYYLDFIYNFGVLAILPVLGLIGWTLYRILLSFGKLWHRPAILGLAGVVVFLLLADNSFKVGMRQPYPGIITFFLWGVLLAWLLRLARHDRNEVYERDDYERD